VVDLDGARGASARTAATNKDAESRIRRASLAVTRVAEAAYWGR
jgi:hypothetical protein